jgi:hypothetical protein
MARPPKDPSLRMDVDLRIPMTEQQKAMVYEAAKSEQSDVAAWVRPILLEAAKSRLDKRPGGKKRGGRG